MTTLTKAQLKFFSKPRTMEEIRTILFGGDDWGANTFQNDQISAGNLEICTVDGKISIKKCGNPAISGNSMTKVATCKGSRHSILLPGA